jgi:hypothetical protein
MAEKKRAAATRPCPHCRQPVGPRHKTCPHCHKTIPAAAQIKTSPPKKRASLEGRSNAAPADRAGQPPAENGKEDNDWIAGLLPTYD